MEILPSKPLPSHRIALEMPWVWRGLLGEKWLKRPRVDCIARLLRQHSYNTGIITAMNDSAAIFSLFQPTFNLLLTSQQVPRERAMLPDFYKLFEFVGEMLPGRNDKWVSF